MKLGIYFYALGSIAAGILDFIWHDFDPGHQPIQAFGDHIPGREFLAYITAVWLVAAGLAVLRHSTTRRGAMGLAIVHLVFTIFWLPRLYTAPHVLGFHAPVIVGVLVGVFQQLILVAAAAVLYELAKNGSSSHDRAFLICRWTFGLGSLIFGANHLLSVAPAAAMVPSWIPLGGSFWTVFTGFGFILAGLAILSRILDVLASRLLGLMLLIFSALALAPIVFAYPHAHGPWGGNAYNLGAVGAAWILGGALANIRLEQRRAGSAVSDFQALSHGSRS